MRATIAVHRVATLMALSILTGPFIRQVAAQETNQADPLIELEAAFSRCMTRIRAADAGEDLAEMQRLERSLGSIICGLSAYGIRHKKVEEDSDDSVVRLVYSVFIGDATLFERMKDGAELTPAMRRTVEHRAASLLASYPLSTMKSTPEERISLIMFLSHIANVVPKTTPVILNDHLARLKGADRLPLLVVLETMGDENARKSPDMIDKQYLSEIRRLRRIFKGFHRAGIDDGAAGVK